MVTATFDRLIGGPVMSLIRSIFRKPRRTKVASPSSSSSRSASSSHNETVNKPPSSRSSLTDSITRQPKAPTKFKRFRLLPPEIRAQIWEYALKHPLPTEGYNSTLGPYRNNYRPLASDCIKWPPMLVVCRESRYEAIRYYESKLGPLKQFKDFGNPENDSRTVKAPETKWGLKLIR